MKKMMVAVLLVLLGAGLSGCYRLAATHPEKTEKQFYEDRAFCEEKAREFAFERRQQVEFHDELDHTRRCMQGLGWEYRFRRTSETSEEK